MHSYRFYIIGEDGHIHSPSTIFDAASDADAVRQANKIVLPKQDIEVWFEERLVAYVTFAAARVA